MKTKIQKFSLLIGDIFVLYLSLYSTLLLRYLELPHINTWMLHFKPFSLAFIAWIAIFYISDLYNIHLAINNSKFFNLTLRSVMIAGLLTAVFFYINPQINIAPKTNLLIYLVVFSALFLIWRRSFNSLLFSYLPKDKLLIIGHNEKVRELALHLEQKPHLGYKIALIFTKKNTGRINSIPAANDFSHLKKIIKNQRISTIILASDPHDSANLRHKLFSLLPLRINFMSLVDFYEHITGKIPIDSISEMWFLEKLSEGRKVWFDKVKRIFDVIFGIAVMIPTAVLLPFFYLLLRIENKESIFFIQERMGQNGNNFKLIKFRTQKTVKQNPEPSRANDNRNTRVGRFFRKTRLDELPQFLNIIKGEMSFIGPRPERPELVRGLEKSIPFYKERLLVKPGLTGWAQTVGGYLSPSREDTLKKLQYDLFYIKNRSLYLDLAIILKTIATVVKRSGV